MTPKIHFRTVLLCFNAAERPLVLLLGGEKEESPCKILVLELGMDLQSLSWVECCKLGDFYRQHKLQGPEFAK